MPPVARLPLGGWVDPVVAFRALAADHPHLVLLDRSGAATDRVGFVGIASSDDDLLVEPSPTGTDPVGRVTRALRARLPAADSAHLGWWGWFGYELGAAGLGAPAAPAPSPAAAFLLAAVGAVFDHDAATVEVVALPGREADAAALAGRLRPLVGVPLGQPPAPPAATATWRHGHDEYVGMVEACRRAIAAGDAYQLCLTNTVTVQLSEAPDPADLHLRLRAVNAVPAAGILRIAGWTLVSASPETFVDVAPDGRARTRPIKGTRPRSADPAEDARLAAELAGSEKERAENLMIVDLVRNDLARVARTGSVEVERLFAVESYPSVHQLVSTVAADLTGDPLDAVAALFPAGSMTGAPKRAAVELLAGLEAGPRGIYAGAWGRIAADGGVALSMVIRTVVVHGRTATVGTGGGITILSDPEEEWRETLLKARPLLGALFSRIRTDGTTRRTRRPERGVPPDPS